MEEARNGRGSTPERDSFAMSAILPTVDESEFQGSNPPAPGGASRIDKTIDMAANALSRHALAFAVIWVCAVAVSLVGFSRQKPLWADEVIFRWIATSPSVRHIWQALTLGLNTDPPLDHLLTHALAAVFGSSALVLRLTSMAGICVMLLCLFLTLRKFTGPLYALLGLLIPFCTLLVDYGYEARPYGLMYGSFALAIYAWVKAGEDGSAQAPWWNFVLWLALSAALACHFYAAFALPAFYFGEAVRIGRRHRVNWATVAAIVVGSATLLLFLPIIIGARQYSSSYFEKPSLTSVPIMLVRSLDQLVIPLFAFLAFVALFATLGVRFNRETHPEENTDVRELTALSLGFLLIPLLAWGAGIFVLKAFTTRYVLHALLGVFLLLPLFAGRVFRSDRALALALLLACALPAAVFVFRGAHKALKAPARNENLAQLAQIIPNLSGDIAVSDPHLFLELVNDSPALKAKCIYLWDRENEVKYSGQDGFSHFAGAGVRMGWFRAEPWATYPEKNDAFFFVTTPDNENDGIGWLRAYLEGAHRYGEVVSTTGQYVVVQAKPVRAAPLRAQR
jgi:hypothetical protein